MKKEKDSLYPERPIKKEDDSTYPEHLVKSEDAFTYLEHPVKSEDDSAFPECPVKSEEGSLSQERLIKKEEEDEFKPLFRSVVVKEEEVDDCSSPLHSIKEENSFEGRYSAHTTINSGRNYSYQYYDIDYSSPSRSSQKLDYGS